MVEIISKLTTNNMTKKDILKIIIILLAIDFMGWVAWQISGQIPQDGFYLGAITQFIINLILN